MNSIPNLTYGFQLLHNVIAAVRRCIHRYCDGLAAFFHQIQIMNQYYLRILQQINSK